MTDFGVIKQTIANILQVPVSEGWTICSDNPEKQLYLVHYTQNSNMERFGELRGVVVDLVARTVVCRSFGYTPTATTSKLVVAEDGHFHLTDQNFREHVISPDYVSIKLGFEGTILRVFKHGGIVYHSTHRRLNPVNSRWGNSITFLEMYSALNGPADDVLFNPKSDYSPYCHIFLMVHPDVLVATKQDVGPGYLVYLGPKQMWSTDYATCPYKQVQENGALFPGVTEEQFELDPRPNAGYIDPELRVPPSVNILPPKITQPITFSPFNLDLEAANKHLQYGFYDPFDDSTLDPRLGTGEFVILYKKDLKGAITGLLKVQSKAYQWRSDMRDNNPNLLNRMYQLLNGSYIRTETPEGYQDYISRFPLMTPYTVESIQKELPIVVWPQTSTGTNLNTKDDRFFNIWMCFLMSVPLSRQFDVSQMYDQVLTDRAEVIRWLQAIEQEDDLENEEIPDRAKTIIRAARNFAQQKTDSGQNYNRAGRPLSIKVLTADNIRNLINKEEGSSLYRLAKSMKEMQTLNEEQTDNVTK